MEERNNLVTGDIGKVLLRFVLPYLLSCFMQTFYGMADLFVVGQFYGSEVTSAVSIGSHAYAHGDPCGAGHGNHGEDRTGGGRRG